MSSNLNLYIQEIVGYGVFPFTRRSSALDLIVDLQACNCRLFGWLNNL